VLLQKRPSPTRYFRGVTVYYCTREVICIIDLEVSRLRHRAVLDVPVRDGVAPTNTARPCRPTVSRNDAPTGPTSIAGQLRSTGRRLRVKRWLLPLFSRWRIARQGGVSILASLHALGMEEMMEEYQ
jgi:hypothetical protein